MTPASWNVPASSSALMSSLLGQRLLGASASSCGMEGTHLLAWRVAREPRAATHKGECHGDRRWAAAACQPRRAAAPELRPPAPAYCHPPRPSPPRPSPSDPGTHTEKPPGPEAMLISNLTCICWETPTPSTLTSRHLPLSVPLTPHPHWQPRGLGARGPQPVSFLHRLCSPCAPKGVISRH